MAGESPRLLWYNQLRQFNRQIDNELEHELKPLISEFVDIESLVADEPTVDYTNRMNRILTSLSRKLNNLKRIIDMEERLLRINDTQFLQPRLRNNLRRYEHLYEQYTMRFRQMEDFYDSYPNMVIQIEDGYVFPPLELQNPSRPQQVDLIPGYPLVVNRIIDLTGRDKELPCFCYSEEGIDENNQSLCRMNCGDVAHCSCINKFLNTRLRVGETDEQATPVSNTGEDVPPGKDIFDGWSSTCPKCRQRVTMLSKAQLPPAGMELSFGKSKKVTSVKLVKSAKTVKTVKTVLRNVDKDIMYLKK